MAQQVVLKPKTEKRHFGRVILYSILAVIPAAMITLFYIFDSNIDVMDWVNESIAAPYRAAAATVTSFGPFQYFSIMEVLITLIILWVLYYIIKIIVGLIRGPQRLAGLGRRLLIMLLVGAYIFSAYSWTWGIGYRSTSLASQTGLDTSGVSVEQLAEVTQLFAENANELAGQVARDADGHLETDTNYIFALSKGVYTNIVAEFPTLDGKAYPPKAMMYSKLMSIIGFTGVYISLTGEANINIDAPSGLMPATIAHEMAHQRGVNAEQEANFAGIAACITSNIDVYEYSGYFSGLLYLISALNETDPDRTQQIISTLNDDVLRDWSDNGEYWSQYDTAASEAVTAIYDTYLKANGETLGIKSYGACVDMLVTWLA